MALQGRPTIPESSWEAGENYDTLIRICASVPKIQSKYLPNTVLKCYYGSELVSVTYSVCSQNFVKLCLL
jgi:hypothetical protein